MKTINNEDGMILLTVLILIFISTLTAVVSINSSTIEVQIAGHEKKVSTAFAAAEAGIDLAIPIIEYSLAEGSLQPKNLTVNGKVVKTDDVDQVYKEISNQSYANDPDEPTTEDYDIFIENLGGLGVTVAIDIDRLYSQVIAGGALEFAMGYEGVGAGAAGGGVATYFRIKSAGTR